MTQETRKIWSLYRITNTINGKIYIGQTVEPAKRWYQHRRDAANPKYPIHHAINKYGAHNFEFEVIASCFSQDDTNWAEEELIRQYNCLVGGDKGYNIALGGSVAPKSEEWKQAMREWHASLSSEERAEISKKQSEATQQQIETKGHPALGTKRTDEQRANMSIVQKQVENRFDEEALKKMSESHIGHKDSEETKAKKSEAAKEAWEKKIDYSRQCQAPGCTVSGKAKYKIIDGVRYCNMHGLRMLRYGRLESLMH